MADGKDRLRRWPLAVLTALDRLLNAILLGDDRSTISARTYYARQKGERWAAILGGLLDRIDHDHCKRAADFDAAVRKVIAEQPRI